MNKRRRYKAKRRRRLNKLKQRGQVWVLSNGSIIVFIEPNECVTSVQYDGLNLEPVTYD